MAEQWWRETWKEAIYASDVGTPARLVAMIHADFARDKTWTYVDMATLMRCTRLRKSQVLAARKQLVDAGLLRVRKKAAPGRAPHFDMLIPPVNGSGNPEANGSGNPEVLDGDGSGNPDQRVRESGMTGPGSRTLSISNQSIHQSLSPEQELVRDLLGLDPNDEREMALIRNTHKLLDQHPGIRSTKAWLRGWKKNELRAELEALSTSTDDGWGAEPDDDTMANPGYIDGWGTPERVKVEDYYRRQIRALGYTDDEATAYFDQATNVHPTGSKRTRWTEAYMTAQAEARYRDAS